MNLKYFVTFGRERIGEFKTLKEAQEAVANHSEYYKSKYTKQGKPRSNYSDLKRFWITDNMGDMYYIY